LSSCSTSRRDRDSGARPDSGEGSASAGLTMEEMFWGVVGVCVGVWVCGSGVGCVGVGVGVRVGGW
jgi:hypothetical protein